MAKASKSGSKTKAKSKKAAVKTAEPVAAAVSTDELVTREQWKEQLRALGRDQGFCEDIGKEHTALFVRRSDTLIVTFENLDHVFENNETRLPWAFGFIEKKNWSILGLMAHGWTWYRDEDVFDFFDRLRDEGFFDGFKTVMFYGASMGGYAAAAFSAACPGATVFCVSPQATLDREIAPWETRYRKVWHRNFTNRYGFAPDMLASAEQVHLFFDPRESLDSMHAALFRGPNIKRYHSRFFGHRIASLWIQLGILKPLVEAAVEKRLNPMDYYKMLRARRENARYQREMLQRLIRLKRPELVVRYCEAILARRRGPKFRQALNAARAELRR